MWEIRKRENSKSLHELCFDLQVSPSTIKPVIYPEPYNTIQIAPTPVSYSGIAYVARWHSGFCLPGRDCSPALAALSATRTNRCCSWMQLLLLHFISIHHSELHCFLPFLHSPAPVLLLPLFLHVKHNPSLKLHTQQKSNSSCTSIASHLQNSQPTQTQFGWNLAVGHFPCMPSLPADQCTPIHSNTAWFEAPASS